MQADEQARAALDVVATAVVHARQGVCADVIRIVDVRGHRAPMLRVWRGAVPYVVRGQSEKLLCSTNDKAFRSAIASSLTDDTFITNMSGDFDMQARVFGTRACCLHAETLPPHALTRRASSTIRRPRRLSSRTSRRLRWSACARRRLRRGAAYRARVTCPTFRLTRRARVAA